MALFRQRRGSTLVGWGLMLGCAGVALILLDGHGLRRDEPSGRNEARAARLTDPALFTEARYARHASQADRHAAFQDHPLALEHFPAGSLMPAPGHERLD
jgi:hypothetical protein